MKCRFVSFGRGCGIGKVYIPNTGFETADPEIIDFLRNSEAFGVLFCEVDSVEKLNANIIEHAKKLMEDVNTYRGEPIPVPTVELPDIKEEEAAFEAEEKNRREDEMIEQAIKEYKQQKAEAAKERKNKKAAAKK